MSVGGGRIVRGPNHLGDLVMALPALEASSGADVLVARWLVPLLELAREGAREAGRGAPFGTVVPLDRGTRGLLRAARVLRQQRYAGGVLLTPSFSSALLFRLAGIGERRGSRTDSRGALLTDGLDPRLLSGVHRSASYLILVTGEAPAVPPTPHLALPTAVLERFDALVPAGDAPRVGIFPGSNAPSRRWDPERFAEVAARLRARGAEVLVFGGPGEREITARVAGSGATDLGGRTDMGLLAAGLASCSLVVSNDSGPMHLAAAVGTPTVSLWGAGDPAHTAVVGAEHLLLRRPLLPCVPCRRNVCPRAGQKGYELPDAERECIRLIAPGDVEHAVLERLELTTR